MHSFLLSDRLTKEDINNFNGDILMKFHIVNDQNTNRKSMYSILKGMIRITGLLKTFVVLT